MNRFNVISYSDNKWTPHAIELLDENYKYVETFYIGDEVTNSAGMRGKIVEFSLHDGTCYVTTDWSGVGTNLESIQKVVSLPCKFQMHDQVYVTLDPFGNKQQVKGNIRGIHFYKGLVKYDVDLELKIPSTLDNPAGIATTRLYNLISSLLTPVKAQGYVRAFEE